MESPAEHTLTMLDACVHNPLRMKSFHVVWAGNVQECSLESRIGKASPSQPKCRRLYPSHERGLASLEADQEYS
jgi:hypothetical protein